MGQVNLKHQPGIAHRALGYRAVQVLNFIRSYTIEHGRAPGLGTIRDALDFNDKAEVSRVVARLEKRGLIMRVGAGRVRRGSQWNQPTIKAVLDKAFPLDRSPLIEEVAHRQLRAA